MRIVVDARPIADYFPGIGRYTYNLLAALSAIDHPHEILALTCPKLPNTRYDLTALDLQLIPTNARPFSPAEHLVIPQLLGSLRADLYHATYYVRPYVGLPCRSVTTLYDAIPFLFPAAVSPRARLLFDRLNRLAIRASTRLLTISESARADLIAAFGIRPDSISVTPLAPDPHFQPQTPTVVAELRARYNLPEHYMLCFGSNKPHKNIAGLVQAYQLLAASNQPLPPLVIAGHWDERHPEARALVGQLGLAAQVRFLAHVAERDLPALYSGAELFIFPSLYEGFGLPPLEALACGVPVICGGNSSLPEVVGSAAQICDVAVPDALAAAIAQVLDDPALQAQLRAAGLIQAARFNWHTTAELTLAAYLGAASSTSAAFRMR